MSLEISSEIAGKDLVSTVICLVGLGCLFLISVNFSISSFGVNCLLDPGFTLNAFLMAAFKKDSLSSFVK